LTELFETPFFSDFLLMRTQKSLTLNKTMWTFRHLLFDKSHKTDEIKTKQRKHNRAACCWCDDVLPECLNTSSHSSVFRVGNDEIEPTK
jgi:hypothetical protein